MVQVKRGFVFGAFIVATIAVLLSIVSISTEYWVEADLKYTLIEVGQETSSVRYGLLSGIFQQALPNSNSRTSYEITMTCLYGENVCAVLCRDNKENREQELQDLYDNKEAEPNFVCPFHVQKSFMLPQMPKTNQRSNSNRIFMNAASYLCTVIFLSVSIAFGVLSSCLLFWNVIGNPVQTYFSIYSLYYYIGIAAVTLLIAIIVWGAMFAATITENVGILYTISNQMRHHGSPTLGYSYWLNLGALFLYMISNGLLLTRKYLIENQTTIHRNIDQGNQVIF